MTFFNSVRRYFTPAKQPFDKEASILATSYDPLKDYNREAVQEIKKLQHLARTNAIVFSAVQKWADKIAGSDWSLQGTYDKNKKNSFNKIKQAWLKFSENPDLTNGLDLSSFFNSLVKSRFVDGEAFVNFLIVGKNLKLQQISATRIPQSLHENEPSYAALIKRLKENSQVKNIYKGIGFNLNKQRIAYFYNSAAAQEQDSLEFNKIKKLNAKDTAHYFSPFLNDTRGFSKLIPVSTPIRDLDKYIEEMLSCKAKLSQILPILQFDSSKAQTFGSTISKSGEELYKEFQKSKIKTNDDNGKGIKLPDFVNLSFPDFEKLSVDDTAFINNVKMIIASSLGLSASELFEDFQKMSYSSSRMSAKLLQLGYQTERKLFKTQIVSKVFQKFKENAIKNQDLTSKDFEGITFDFVPDKFIEVDPQKQAQAYQTLLNMGVESVESICNQIGLDFSTILQQNKLYKKEINN